MAEKHIFIGLGGSGVNTVTSVKYKIYEKLVATKYQSRLDLLNADYRFLFVDTDSNAIDANNKSYGVRFENGSVDFIDPNKELIDLGDQNPRQIYIEASKDKTTRMNKHILEACDDTTAAKIPNSTLRRGASGFRIKSRIAFARKSDAFIERLSACITDLYDRSKDAANRDDIYYWIVCSSNGGTGSGVVNDALYYVNMLHKQHIGPVDPYVVLVMYMPQFYIDKNSTEDKYPKNAFAVFSEIEALQCMAKEKKETLPVDFHRLALLNDYHQFDTNVAYRPFMYCIPIDYQTDKDTNLGNIDNMYYNTAEMLYYIHGGAGGREFRSGADNYVYDKQVDAPKSFLIPMGYIALRKPEKDFDDYMQLRMRYELLRYGIIGEKIQTEGEYQAITDAIYSNIIADSLFNGAHSAYNFFRSIVDTSINDSLPDSLIRNHEGKIVKTLPANISTTDAERIISEIEQDIYRNRDKKQKALKEIEVNLWKWVEKNVEQHGLEYVEMCLLSLDMKCTEAYNSFAIEQPGKSSMRKILQRNIDGLEGSLDELYKNAIEVTAKEKILGKNREDVYEYYTKLKQLVMEKADLAINELIYDIVKELCEDDKGIIDKIRHHVDNMLAEAHRMLKKEGGAKAAYDSLAKSFLEKGRDVTSVYLPDIQEFVGTTGWKENHKFAAMYALVIRPTNMHDQGKGFIPVRSGTEGSLQFLMNKIVEVNQTVLQEKGYINTAGNAQFFSSGNQDSIKKTLEDYLYFATLTFQRLYSDNNDIQNQWLSKDLSKMFNELDNEKRKEIRGRLDPCLFLTYNKARDNNKSPVMNIYIAESRELAVEVFGFNPNDNKTRFAKIENAPSMVYMIKAKLGLSLDYYRPYDVIKNVYDSSPRKEEFHFHSSFARCNGDYKRMSLPKEFDPELISFVRYMLMDGYRGFLSDYYHSSSNNFDRDNYTNTPFVMEEKRALVATGSNISKRGENICLTVKSGTNIEYASFVFEDAENPYKTVYEKFKTEYVNQHFKSAIEGLITDMIKVSQSLMEEHFAEVSKTLVTMLDTSIGHIKSREEKSFVAEILKVLTEELNTFDKFLPRKS